MYWMHYEYELVYISVLCAFDKENLRWVIAIELGLRIIFVFHDIFIYIKSIELLTIYEVIHIIIISMHGLFNNVEN